MIFKILPIMFLAAMTLSAQITKNSVNTGDLPPIESGVSQELAHWRSARYSDVRYKLNLTLEKMSPVLKGTIEIRVKVAQKEPASGRTVIVLDWRKIKGHESKSSVTNVTMNGIALSEFAQSDASGKTYQTRDEHLIFNDGVAGENVIKLDFTSPILTSGSAITRYVDKEDGSEYIYSLFVPSDASTAFPVFDQPDLKAKFSINVITANDWKVVSNTFPITENYKEIAKDIASVTLEKNLVRIWSFAETKPISTYVFAFAAGPWEKVAELPVLAGSKMSITGSASSKPETSSLAYADSFAAQNSIYVRKSQAEKFKPHAAEVFRLNREAVKYFEQYFDYKFPFPKYDLVLIPQFPFGGMEHAGATFLRESAIIFPQEPTKNDHISRAALIFHEAAHQWFGDTVTMRWFDDLWLKEGFATFTAYKAMEKIMPEMNAWKVFYERVKQGAYQTDSTKGTTPIYQEIKNLSAAKSAYGAIVYNKAPAFLRQAEFHLGEDKFQTAVRTFLKKHEFGNAKWEDLVKEFNSVHDRRGLPEWARYWVTAKGVPLIRVGLTEGHYEKSAPVRADGSWSSSSSIVPALGLTLSQPFEESDWAISIKTLYRYGSENEIQENVVSGNPFTDQLPRLIDKDGNFNRQHAWPDLIFPNYQDYGYGIFLLDNKSRDYVLKNIQSEKDPFLRAMMWGSLWDSVREGELNPREYVELAVKNLEKTQASAKAKPAGNVPFLDETTVQLLLARVSTAINYYISSGHDDLSPRVENMLIERMQNAETLGQRITYYRAFLNIAASENARKVLRNMLTAETLSTGRVSVSNLSLKTKDRFDIVTRLLILNDPDALKMLTELEKTEISDDAKRYAYAARAGIATAENKAKYWNDFVNNKDISESWIEAAFGPWNSIRHSELTVPYLQKALLELPNHKRNRKIFFVNGWLGAFIGGQNSEHALSIVNKFLADNPNLDKDLRLKILENVDVIERAVKIRTKY